MIVFNLICTDCEYTFEGWFDNAAAFNSQKRRKLITCPNCERYNIKKALAAPNVGKKSNSKILKNKKTLANNIKKIKKVVEENFEKEINTDNRSIKISIKYFIKSLVLRKKIIDEDTLFLFCNEASSFDMYKDDKNFVNILLYKNTGISLSNKTVINSKFNKNLLLIEIQNKDEE